MCKRILPALLLVCAVSALALAAPGAIRLRVIAHSDAPADQAYKLYVRDIALGRLQGLLSGAGGAAEAYARLAAALPEIERSTGARAYLEPGALLLVIGDGQGRNYWCVLFPPLCFQGFARLEGVPEDRLPTEEELQRLPVQARFAILEWIRHRFRPT